ncbi:hypothetical protein [Planotetraspora kaengkrachanensis]|uniref:hypothetical protein n=1 Tax=Planotetraspora kaengkrachanensis TaxID=575193 RepID=UPI0019417FD0|nr:hypothetical protein [Planotetraspora kaengkrachanensis]
MSIYPEHVAATRAPTYWWLFSSRRWTPPLPINVYVIELERIMGFLRSFVADLPAGQALARRVTR